MTFRFFSRCVEWPVPVEELEAIYDSEREITRRTFLRYVDPEEMLKIEKALGYERDPRRGLTMKKDYHVSYFKSTFRGEPCVRFVWSLIDYVFSNARVA